VGSSIELDHRVTIALDPSRHAEELAVELGTARLTSSSRAAAWGGSGWRTMRGSIDWGLAKELGLRAQKAFANASSRIALMSDDPMIMPRSSIHRLIEPRSIRQPRRENRPS